MKEVRFHPLAALLLATSVFGGGCAVLPGAGDRLFRAGDLSGAEAAYRQTLENRPGGRRKAKALYRLGLIHALPESSSYSPAQATAYLEQLLAIEPPTRFNLQAGLILKLQITTSELRDSITAHLERTRNLNRQLDRLRTEAERVETEATDQQARAGRLAAEIARLREQIAGLGDELAAREEELERLKKVDLADPP